jgi:hypothetical protein
MQLLYRFNAAVVDFRLERFTKYVEQNSFVFKAH